jgi:putative spermidine/putrescine transport system substrate-binding protein
VRKVILAVLILSFVNINLFSAGSGDSLPSFEERLDDLSWEDILDEAKGQSVYFFMWGGSETYNSWVSTWLGDRLRSKYDIRLVMVPIDGAGVFVNKVLGEKQAGKTRDGAVDLMWINGENFKTMRQADLLFGPYAQRLPNLQYIDPKIMKFDFGYPIEGYESPYGAAQSVMEYDSARVSDPPADMGALFQWARENPGKLTYPAPPDFTGSVFVRHVFYYVAENPQLLMGDFDEDLYNEIAPRVWDLLNGIEPYLWRKGETYPESFARAQQLFGNGEIYFNLNYGADGAADAISKGQYPDSVKTYMFETGMIGNTNFVAISFNSAHKAAAMVVANELLDPEVQYHAASPEGMRWMTPLDMNLIPAAIREQFEALPLSPSRLPTSVLNDLSLPEIQSDWLVRIEEDWQKYVLRK